jgi:ferredoxin
MDTQVIILVYGQRHAFCMPRDGGTVLAAGLAAGIDLPYSCEVGSCATCRAKLISGQARMLNNLILDDPELAAGYVLACQTVPESAVLSLDFDA